jgi:hypothetical protein
MAMEQPFARPSVRPGRNGHSISSDKIPDKYAGAPGAVKSPKAKGYDLFKTFRHAPANAKESQADTPTTPVIKPEK